MVIPHVQKANSSRSTKPVTAQLNHLQKCHKVGDKVTSQEGTQVFFFFSGSVHWGPFVGDFLETQPAAQCPAAPSSIGISIVPVSRHAATLAVDA